MKYLRVIILPFLIIPYSMLIGFGGYLLRPFDHMNAGLLQKLYILWGKIIAWGMSIDIHPRDIENLNSDEPQLLLCNHQSNIDPVILWCIKPNAINLCFAAKDILFKLPILGQLLKHNKSIVIERLSPKNSLKRLFAAFAKPPYIRSLVIFPEGTRNTSNIIMPLKKGPFILAKKFNLRIIPIRINGALEVLPPGGFAPNLGRKVSITCCKPITSEEVESLDIDKLVEMVHHSMQMAVTS
jgi:1-acyl-sn-glycerol-3-phosphate acyltransferase